MDAALTRVKPEDLDAVLALLSEASLPLDGVAEHFANFLVADLGDSIFGTVGLEVYGRSALLRSLAVDSRCRGQGLGSALTDRMLTEARSRGVERVFLLTETAPEFFAKFGFKRIERDGADEAIHQSVEFQAACCESAICMQLAARD